MKIHWTTIISMLGCALTTAYLVIIEGWSAGSALFAVAGSGMAICGLVLAGLWALSKPEDKATFMGDTLEIMRRDFHDFLRMLRIRR